MRKQQAPLTHRDPANAGQTRFNEEVTDAVRRLQSQPGRLLRAPQLLTSTGTYAPPADCTAIWVECIGGGGGGGGAGFSTPNCAAGAGGGAGAYAGKWYSTKGKQFTYTIGSAGSGGTVSGGTGNSGTAGGSTTFSDGVTTLTAAGGSAGTGMNSGTGFNGVAGAAGGAATNADVGVAGGSGHPGFRPSTSVAQGGNGGSSLYGAGGVGAFDAPGTAATSYGAGGGGGASLNAARAGGNGSAGCILIWEYS